VNLVPDRASLQLEDVRVTGVARLARAGGDRFYVLGLLTGWAEEEWHVVPALWRIRDDVYDTYAVEVITFAPFDQWGDKPENIRVIAVDAGTDDTVYVGGTSADSGAQLFRSPVAETSFIPEHVGARVHPDLHAIQIIGPPERRQVWVATDGGVFVSDSGGGPCTYVAVNTGIAALEPEFARSHPIAGQLVAAGTQDNGTDIRLGDTTWKVHAGGDGGGLAFLPHAPHVLVYQYTNVYWGTRTDEFVDPFTRARGWPDFEAQQEQDITDSEYWAANFYSGAAAVTLLADGWPPASRLAIGTNRVWVSDDLPAEDTRANTWRVLPYPGGRSLDPRAGWTLEDPAFDQGFGSTGLGPLFTLAWASPAQLIAVFDGGVVRWTERSPAGSRNWRTETWKRDDGPWHPHVEFTDVCPIPGSTDFYLTTNGIADNEDQCETVWLISYHDDSETFVAEQTGFGRQRGGPRDPVFSIVLDPADAKVVFVGTVTGVWRGEPDEFGERTWAPYTNGLPQAIVQDLHVWSDPDSGTRLLRAALASRGLWEVDLGMDARRETWIRATPYDDRRLPLVRYGDPWAPSGDDEDDNPDWLLASPDIVVRPA
jgi:hypothetical protein